MKTAITTLLCDIIKSKICKRDRISIKQSNATASTNPLEKKPPGWVDGGAILSPHLSNVIHIYKKSINHNGQKLMAPID